MSKKLIGGLLTAVLLAATPAWANGGHGHGRHWHKHHAYKHDVRRHYVVREVWRPVPVYSRAVYPVYPAPAPGIHIVVPSLFIPFR